MHNSIPSMVSSDSVRLRQVFNNLIGNAIKFTKTGSVTISADLLKVENNINHIRFEIKDTGIGIHKDNHHKIFGVFQQAESATTKIFGGTGLGLNISKKIIELMNGTIGFTSEYGMGSCFWFELKLPNSTLSSTHITSIKSTSDYALTHSTPIKLLVAEDNDTNSELIKIFLRETGFIIDFAGNGKIACDFFQSTKYDLVLMDIQMPIMNGLDATKSIRIWEITQGKIRTPILALTAGISENELTECYKHGCDGHIEKPFTKDILIKTINHYLQSNYGIKKTIL